MQQQIIKVDDIEKSIREAGLQYYVDRLIQNGLGDYFYVEHRLVDDKPFGVEWNTALVERQGSMPGDEQDLVRYRILPVPIDIAWFVIDALRLQSQVLCVGNGCGSNIEKYVVKDGEILVENL
jgi:hypothetical protein